MSSLPPFRTATLAKLYLAQGHLDAARAIATDLSGDDAEAVQQALTAATERQVALLAGLLEQVRDRRRGRAE